LQGMLQRQPLPIRQGLFQRRVRDAVLLHRSPGVCAASPQRSVALRELHLR
jgi:hypothetical protein